MSREFRLNIDTEGAQSNPVIVTLEDGGFVGVWETSHLCGADPDGTHWRLSGRKFFPNMINIFPECDSEPTYGITTSASIDRLNQGFVMVWVNAPNKSEELQAAMAGVMQAAIVMLTDKIVAGSQSTMTEESQDNGSLPDNGSLRFGSLTMLATLHYLSPLCTVAQSLHSSPRASAHLTSTYSLLYPTPLAVNTLGDELQQPPLGLNPLCFLWFYYLHCQICLE